MNTWKIILATLVIFTSGVVTGVLLDRKAEHPSDPDSAVSPATNDVHSPAPWHAQRADFLRKIERHLDLTSEQRERIERILQESNQRTQPIWDEIGPQLREELQNVREQVRGELTLEQQTQFDEVMTRPQHRRSDDPRFRDDRRRPGDPPRQPHDRNSED